MEAWFTKATKADKLAALSKLKEKPAKGRKVPVLCASGATVEVDLGQFWTDIKDNFGPSPQKAPSKLTAAQKGTLEHVTWVQSWVRAVSG